MKCIFNACQTHILNSCVPLCMWIVIKFLSKTKRHSILHVLVCHIIKNVTTNPINMTCEMAEYYFNTRFTMVGCGLGRSHTFGPVTLLFSTQRRAYQGVRARNEFARTGFQLPLRLYIAFYLFPAATYYKLLLNTGRCNVLRSMSGEM